MRVLVYVSAKMLSNSRNLEVVAVHFEGEPVRVFPVRAGDSIEVAVLVVVVLDMVNVIAVVAGITVVVDVTVIADVTVVLDVAEVVVVASASGGDIVVAVLIKHRADVVTVWPVNLGVPPAGVAVIGPVQRLLFVDDVQLKANVHDFHQKIGVKVDVQLSVLEVDGVRVALVFIALFLLVVLGEIYQDAGQYSKRHPAHGKNAQALRHLLCD